MGSPQTAPTANDYEWTHYTTSLDPSLTEVESPMKIGGRNRMLNKFYDPTHGGLIGKNLKLPAPGDLEQYSAIHIKIQQTKAPDQEGLANSTKIASSFAVAMSASMLTSTVAPDNVLLIFSIGFASFCISTIALYFTAKRQNKTSISSSDLDRSLAPHHTD